MDGVFGLLTNVVWTSPGRARSRASRPTRARLRAAGQHVTVYGVDKFPRMVDYVVPDRRADRRRRPGPARRPPRRGHDRDARGLRQLQRRHARHLDGRGPDLRRRRGRRRLRRRRRRLDHGHAVGRRHEVVSVGQRCLLGANAGIGISLGDDCVVEAGCYVTAGTKVTVVEPDGEPRVVKALELSGADNVLFRRNSVTGAVEAVPWQQRRRRAQRGAARQLTDPVRTTGPRGATAGRRAASASPCVVAGRRRRGRAPARRGLVPFFARDQCSAEVDGHTVVLEPDAGRARRADRGDRGRARAAGPGGDDRAGDGVPGVGPAEPRRRRPRLARAVPAAPVAGLGHARSRSSTRSTRPTRSTTRWSKVDGYEDMEITEAAQRGAALGVPRRVRRPRGRRPRAGLGADRQLAARRSAAGSAATRRGRRRARRQRPDRPRGRRTPRPRSARSATSRSAGSRPAGSSTGHMEGSAHYDGRAIDVFVRPVNADQPAPRLGDRAVPGQPGRPARHPHGDLRRPDLDRGPPSDDGWRDYDPPGARRRPGDPRAPRPRARRRA